MLEEEKRKELKNRLEREFSDYYEISGGKNYRFHQLEAVRKLALKLAEKIDEDPDRKVLEIAALYHDIGRAEDIEDGEMDPFKGHEGHDERGAEKVGEFISENVSKEELEKIEKMIRNHHSEAKTLEGRIMQDADDLSNFGVNNLWRQIHYASYHELDLEDSFEYFWDTAVNEYQQKIEEMYFEETREIARKRLERHKEAVENIERERNAEDF